MRKMIFYAFMTAVIGIGPASCRKQPEDESNQDCRSTWQVTFDFEDGRYDEAVVEALRCKLYSREELVRRIREENQEGYWCSRSPDDLRYDGCFDNRVALARAMRILKIDPDTARERAREALAIFLRGPQLLGYRLDAAENLVHGFRLDAATHAWIVVEAWSRRARYYPWQGGVFQGRHRLTPEIAAFAYDVAAAREDWANARALAEHGELEFPYYEAARRNEVDSDILSSLGRNEYRHAFRRARDPYATIGAAYIKEHALRYVASSLDPAHYRDAHRAMEEAGLSPATWPIRAAAAAAVDRWGADAPEHAYRLARLFGLDRGRVRRAGALVLEAIERDEFERRPDRTASAARYPRIGLR